MVVVVGIILCALLAAVLVSMWVLWGTYDEHDSVIEDRLSDMLQVLDSIEKYIAKM